MDFYNYLIKNKLNITAYKVFYKKEFSMLKKKETFIEKYKEFELLEGRAPFSVFEYCKKFKTNEAAFYEHFNSLSQLRKQLMVSFINDTINALDADSDYSEFNSKEKLLALFYTLFENFKQSRSYLIHKYDKKTDMKGKMDDWSLFFLQFNARLEHILSDAKANNEIKEIPYIGSQYAKAFKLALIYVFRVWINDESKQFETTDAAIEKSITVAHEMLSSGPLDALFDFGRFAIKTKVS